MTDSPAIVLGMMVLHSSSRTIAALCKLHAGDGDAITSKVIVPQRRMRELVIMNEQHRTFGSLLQAWRKRRRLSQLDLSVEAGVSQRHLSFLESGRSTPSRDMVLHLAEFLEVPLRDRNALLLAAGLAPVLAARDISHPDLAIARSAVEAILQGHAPNPALAVNRHWELMSANEAVAPLLAGVSERLLSDSPNVLRISLHPDGLSSRIRNLRDWRAHVFHRLAKQIDATADPVLIDLLAELRSYPVPTSARPPTPAARHWGEYAFALQLAVADGPTLSLLTTTTVFGTATDVTLSELAIESFFPADARTQEFLIQIAGRKETHTQARR